MSKKLTPDDYAAVLAFLVLHSADGLVKNFEDPPGRGPHHNWLTTLSAWFNDLDDENKKMVSQVARRAAINGARCVLCTIDGSSVVEPEGEKGEFRLIFRHPDGSEDVFNAEGQDLLDTLFADEVGAWRDFDEQAR